MPKYKNVTGRIYTLPNGTRLGPDGIVMLTMQEAATTGGALEMVGGQLLVEAPLSIATSVIEESQPTVKIDIDGDGISDLEIKGTIVEE